MPDTEIKSAEFHVPPITSPIWQKLHEALLPELVFPDHLYLTWNSSGFCTLNTKEGVVLTDLLMSIDNVKQIINGQMSAPAKVMAKGLIMTAIKKADKKYKMLQADAPTSFVFKPASETMGVKPKESADLKKAFVDLEVALTEAIKSKVEKPEVIQKGSVEFASPKEILSGERVQLGKATKLYQPVFGSSADSKYHVIALGPVNIAVRCNETHFSIRAAGKELSILGPQLQAAGFTASEHHYSTHVKTLDYDLILKAVGALVFGTGIPFDAVAVSLTPIFGKGV